MARPRGQQGALYEIRCRTKLSVEETGVSELWLRKDNPAGAVGSVAAYVTYMPQGGGKPGPVATTITREPKDPVLELKTATGATERRILEHMQAHPGPFSRGALATVLHKKPATVRLAVRNLLESGALAELENVGKNQPSPVLAEGQQTLPEGA